MRRAIAFVCMAASCASLGCASANVRKIPKRSDYTTWTDEDQRRVDSMCGLRFYRARPYVVVHRPFPLESSVMLVDGVVSADGKWVQILPGTSPRLLSDELVHWGVTLPDGKVPVGSIVRTTAGAASVTDAGGLKAEGAVATSTSTDAAGATKSLRAQGGATDAGGGTTIDPGPIDKITPHAKSEDRPTGTSTLRLSTAIDAVGQTKLRDYFDILYLPDFEEEYVVDPRARLGDVNVSLTQGPGGVLLAMGMQVDNSAITRPLVDAYEELVKQGAAVAKNAMGKAAGLGAQGAATGTPPEKDVPGTIVTLKIHVVKMADPGLYPILKDSEMLESRHCARQFGICHCGACTQGIDASRTHVVPVYPFSRVAYQFHRTVVVEHLIDLPTSPRVVGLGGQGASTRPAADAGASDTDELLMRAMNTMLKGAPGCVSDVRVVGVQRTPLGASRAATTSLIVQVALPTGLVPGREDDCRAAVHTFLWDSRADLGLVGLASKEALTVVAR